MNVWRHCNEFVLCLGCWWCRRHSDCGNVHHRAIPWLDQRLQRSSWRHFLRLCWHVRGLWWHHQPCDDQGNVTVGALFQDIVWCFCQYPGYGPERRFCSVQCNAPGLTETDDGMDLICPFLGVAEFVPFPFSFLILLSFNSLCLQRIWKRFWSVVNCQKVSTEVTEDCACNWLFTRKCLLSTVLCPEPLVGLLPVTWWLVYPHGTDQLWVWDAFRRTGC